MTSWELNEVGQAALDILRADYPEKTLKSLISDALALAVEKSQAAPTIKFGALNSADLIRVQGVIARLGRTLSKFRQDLIVLGKNPDNAGDIASLAEQLETHLAATGELRDTLAKLALVPRALSPANLKTAADLKASLKAWRKTADDDEKPVFDLALTLLRPYLP